ncbi:MAG: hypothetical protein ABR910_13040 [Acidobacteriaceae bacterium]|jgi:hypothetical protein
MSEQNNKPAARINLYPVSAVIWRNQTAKGASYSVTFERSYRDQTGKFQTSTSFSGSELLLLAKAADLAHSEIIKLRVADRASSDQSEDEAA